MFSWFSEPESLPDEAHSDAVAWVVGGILWGLVTSLGQGHPVGLAFGACLALVLRRAVRLLVDF